jgi:integrase
MPVGQEKVVELKRSTFIEFTKWRRDQPTRRGGKVGAATAKQSLMHIAGVIKYACATWDDCEDLVPVLVHLKAAGKFLGKRGLIAKANRRTRRVEDEEVVAMLAYYQRHPGRVLRMPEVIAFCLASGRRRGEVCRITWGDIDFENKEYWVRDLKHPTKKRGNDKRFILFPVIEKVIRRQIRLRPDDPNERIFPFVPESITQSFICAKKAIAAETGNPAILTLRLHDHRAEAISKWLLILDSAEDVAMCVSGHDNTKTIKAHYDRRSPQEVMRAKYGHLMQQPAA